jgi:hypothetical protein
VAEAVEEEKAKNAEKNTQTPIVSHDGSDSLKCSGSNPSRLIHKSPQTLNEHDRQMTPVPVVLHSKNLKQGRVHTGTGSSYVYILYAAGTQNGAWCRQKGIFLYNKSTAFIRTY